MIACSLVIYDGGLVLKLPLNKTSLVQVHGHNAPRRAAVLAAGVLPGWWRAYFALRS